MTVRRMKSILHFQHHNSEFQKRRNKLAMSYFSAAMVALILAVVILLIGLAVIDYEVGSYFDEKPMINIVLPPNN